MTPTLRQSGLRRSVALLLLAIFLGSGTTLPSADALLYHWDQAAESQRPHIEPAGGCGSHTEACSLGRAAAGLDTILPHAPIVRLEPGEDGSGDPPSDRPSGPVDSVTLPPSRAPPVSVA